MSIGEKRRKMSVGEKRRNIDVGSKREKQIVGEKRSERKKKNLTDSPLQSFASPSQTNVDQRLKKLEEGMSTVIRLEKGGKATETIKEEDPNTMESTFSLCLEKTIWRMVDDIFLRSRTLCSIKPVLDAERVQLLYDCMDLKHKGYDRVKLIASQKCRDTKTIVIE
ncbi:uncharacterized protein LOC135343172 isoform X2 [Halichondria panicea]|uniref:uncharacterized protein LOC135343172 isoform X2 n=1 Tax=Halichondria panicea TaxID=6063 RepID=UPI00312BA702